ncbi:RidA family protein [Rhizobium sp. CCGE 510]|uniref:RidA family protein n=1 Tax=Rhizobium sp. CCGE 510 TaxID=1132836 RepID=UPI00027B8FB0|nr:RidA family protein [Rhizobium sp. CCGE 510]EJT05048.1 endoribonuclease L-PSP [Rhizobium sp. CCGE 510]
MQIRHNPAGREPATYTHGIEVGGEGRTLYISGQIGIDADGNIPKDIEAQSNAVFDNLKAVLHEAGMTFEHLVKTTVFLTDRDYFRTFAAVRQAHLGSAKPASTLVIVSGLVHPDLLVEVEAIATANS